MASANVDTQARLLTTVLALGLGVALGRLLARLLRLGQGKPQAPDPVSESGKLIAGGV
jgi:hypothetical protein